MFSRIKTFLLLAVLTFLLLVVGYLLGSKQGLIIAFVVALSLNFLTYWYSDKIVLAMYKAKPASKKQYPELHHSIEKIAEKAKIPKPKLFVLPLDVPNAFATGRNYENSAVAVTEGALDLLDKKELEGVLAHELAHVKNRDTLIQTIAAVIAGIIGFLAFYARILLWTGNSRDKGALGLIALIFIAIFVPIAAMLVQLAISRTREFIADESGSRFLHDSEGLSSALLKLESYAKRKPLQGNNATSHLFIVNPFSVRGMTKLFSTHPPMQERVRRLREMRF